MIGVAELLAREADIKNAFVLVTDCTIEEKLLARLSAKRELAMAALDQDSASCGSADRASHPAGKAYYLVVTRHDPSDDSGTDWRRLASDRNVSHSVARALWEQACTAAPDDPRQAEHAFQLMLDEAAAANLTQEPGRETAADSTADARDASSLGPGKWTRVLLEQQKLGGSAPRGAEIGKQPSAEELRDEVVAAGQAGKNAAAMLAASDRETIVEALRELRGREGSGILHKVMTVAGDAVERMLGQRSQGQTGPAAQGTSTGDQPAQNTPDRVLVTPPPDRKG